MCKILILSFRPQIYDESETDQILNAKYFAWKNYTPRKWGIREAFDQDSLMQLFNGDRRIVHCNDASTPKKQTSTQRFHTAKHFVQIVN